MEDVKFAVEEIEPSTAVYNVVRGRFVLPSEDRRVVDGSVGLQLLVNCGDYLQLWEPVDGSIELRQTFYLFERIDHMDLVPASLGVFGPDSTDTVLLFTFDCRCALFRLQVQAQRDHLASSTLAPSTHGPFVLTEVACLPVPIPALRDGLMPKRLGGVCSSGVAPVSKHMAIKSNARAVVVAAINMGMLHVITLHKAGTGHKGGYPRPGGITGPLGSAAGGGDSSRKRGSGSEGDESRGEPVMMCTVVLIQDTPLCDMPPESDDLDAMAYMSHVYGMCFIPPPERDAFEPPLLVVLHKLERSGGISFTLDCLALELELGGKDAGKGVVAGTPAAKHGTVTTAVSSAAAAAAAGGAGGSDAGAGGSGRARASWSNDTGRDASGGGAGGASGSAAAGQKPAASAAAAATAASSAPGKGSGAADESVPLRAALLSGPWVARFLHPTTTVITPFPGVASAGLPAGVLAISSIGVTLYCRPPTLGAIALAAATAEVETRRAAAADPGPPVGDFSGLDPFDDAAVAALFDRWFGKDFLEDAAIEFAEANVRQVDLVQYALDGMPLCAETLAPGVLLIGDSAAGLTLLHAAGSQAWAARVVPDLMTTPFPAPAMPKLMRYMPLAAGGDVGGGGSASALGREADGLLFLASDCSNSQVLHVPAAHIAALAKPPPATQPPSTPQPPPSAPAKQPPPASSPGSSRDFKMAKGGDGKGKGEVRPTQKQDKQQQQQQQVKEQQVEEQGEEPLPPPLPVLQWPVCELAAIKSLAPVTDVTVVPDPSGADDPWLIASCGRNAAGRLVRARLAAGLQPYMSDGPQVPDGSRMFSLRLEATHPAAERQAGPSSASGPGHTHIAFSFEAADRTDLLSVAGSSPGAGHGVAGGSEFTQVELPGLNHGSASLLVADVAGQRLVQVTTTSVRVLEPLYSGAGLAVEWHAPEPLSLAAHSGSILAAASRIRLHLLRIDPGTGSITALSHTKQLEAQLSALALYRLAPPPLPQTHYAAASAAAAAAQHRPASSLSEAETTFVLMGQWLSNVLEVAAVADLSRSLLQLQLAEDETPRSLALMELAYSGGGGAITAAMRPPVLLAGTNTGRLLMWQLAEAPAAARPWRVGPCYSLRVSQVAVELQPVPASGPSRLRGGGGGGGGYVYVHSYSGALVRPRPQAAAVAAAAAAAGPLALDQLLEVVRVHGSEGLQALCHVSTASMPDSTCWVTREGQLLFGRIDSRVKLRWSTAFVGETIHSFAYHAPSHCLVALCESHPLSDNSLRVIEVNSLHQVMSMRLSYGHYHTAITVGPLPCTSGIKAAARRSAATAAVARRSGAAASTAAATSRPPVPEKELIVLGSYISVDSSCDPEVGKHVHGAEVQYGALSFLEVIAQPAPDGSNATQYRLVLQGTCLVPSVPTSLAIARASPYTAPTPAPASGSGSSRSPAKAGAAEAEAKGNGGGKGSGGGDPVDMPYLLMGCQGRVLLYQVYVDDDLREGVRAVKRAVQLVGQVDELNLPVPKNMIEIEAAFKALDKEIMKRAAAEAKEAAAAAGGSNQAGGADGGTKSGGQGGGRGEEDEGLAEDESELPEVEVNWDERLKALEEAEAEENITWKYGLGLMEHPDPEDAEYFKKWAEERSLEGELPFGPEDAARAVKLLRKRLEREDMLAAADAAGNGGAGGRDRDDSDSSSDGYDGNFGFDMKGGVSGLRRRRRIGPSIRQLMQDLRRDWSNHVTLTQLDSAETFGATCVGSLSCMYAGAGAVAGSGCGSGGAAKGPSSLVVASDYLGSVTVMRLVANKRGPALISCGPDRHPIFAQAADWLDPEHVLVAVHPHGLAVLRRDPGGEEEAMHAAQRKAVADFEAGLNRQRQQQAAAQVWGLSGGSLGQQIAGARSGAGGAAAATTAADAATDAATTAQGGAGRFSLEDLHLLKPRLEGAPGLTMEASCRVRHMVTRMCRMKLGLRPQPHPTCQQHPGSPLPASTSVRSPASTRVTSSTGGARAGAGQGGQTLHQEHQWDAGDLLLCFSASGYVATVRFQHRGSLPATTAPPPPPLAKLARLQHALSSLDAADTALLTGVDSDSYCHGYSWPLVVPRETAAAAGLAGIGGSAVVDETGRRRGTPSAAAAAGTSGAGGGDNHPSCKMQIDDEELVTWEAEAEALAAGSIDGTLLRVLQVAAEAQLRKDAEAEAAAGDATGGRVGSAGGGGRLAALLRRLAREVTGAADLGALVGMLQRSSLEGPYW